MRPVSESFLTTVTGSHESVFRARLLPYGQTGVNPLGGTEVDIVDGNVIFDTRAEVNSTVDIVISYGWPTSISDPINPYGNEIFIERGVVYGEGTREWVSLGYFRIDSVEQDYRAGRIRISGSDRMSRVRDYRPETPYVYTTGTSVQDIVTDVVQDAVPGASFEFDWDADLDTIASDHVMADDRIAFLNELLTAYGKIYYFDYRGVFIVRSVPDANTGSSVIDINSGRDGVLVTFNQSVSRDGVYNVVVARGEPVGDQDPVQGVAYDLDPNSPTYVFGQFGRVPRFFYSSFLTTDLQCADAAESLLRSSTGIPYVVEMGIVPNPALEGWDVIRVLYNPAVAAEVHVIDSVYYPLSVTEPMVMTSRKQL